MCGVYVQSEQCIYIYTYIYIYSHVHIYAYVCMLDGNFIAYVQISTHIYIYMYFFFPRWDAVTPPVGVAALVRSERSHKAFHVCTHIDTLRVTLGGSHRYVRRGGTYCRNSWYITYCFTCNANSMLRGWTVWFAGGLKPWHQDVRMLSCTHELLWRPDICNRFYL